VASVAAAFKWLGRDHSREEIAEASRDIEIHELGIAGGRQDHYAAAIGGALGISFGERVSANRIAISATVAAELPRRCLVMYTGESRISGNTITAVLNAYRKGNPAVRNALTRIRELAERMAAVLGRGDFDELGALVGEHWQHQRSLDPAIPTALIDSMIDRAMKAGAAGCKALGASGGGCVLIIASPDRIQDVRRAVAPLGVAIDYTVDLTGVSECA
jgi:D-glycero-alpha-D-manno-heptose-7-phosphate kinase